MRPIRATCPHCRQQVDCYILRGETRLSAHYDNRDLHPGAPNCRGSDRKLEQRSAPSPAKDKADR